MGLLKDVKETTSQIDNDRLEQADELLTVRSELIDTRKREESERRCREEDRKQHKDELDRSSQERSLRESELKNQLREKDVMLESTRQELLTSR